MKTKYLEIIGLVGGFSAVATLTYFLLSSPGCVNPFEPNPFIRIPEIIWGLFSLIFIGKIIKDKTI